MPFQQTMSQPIPCPPMEPSSSSYSSYSFDSANSSYSGLSDDSLNYPDMYFMSGGTSTGPGSVIDYPLSQPAFEPSSLDSGHFFEYMSPTFNPAFTHTPEPLPLMDTPTSFPMSATSGFSPTSMPVEQSMFSPIDISQEPISRPAKPYACDDCGKSFTRPADLKRHQTTVHYPVFQNCPVSDCSRKDGNGFPRRDHLVEHLRSYHHLDVPKRRAAKRLKVA
ncbi:C2H2-type zinc finger protein [Aspergillus puulaauensis]|uniref:C2H2-type domain-containing protein n=1 Tax=Aspergillus puulaauensis TaxID=1220207 RepID=A0A7R7XZ01_9EURO|nr:uncharacterized protein APUU_70789S [Aspergillus puulaauensis]BCS29219.1 hypothetical protein APUU_70789S [Aspergillus puulaauensis]